MRSALASCMASVGLAVADLLIQNDLERFEALANEHKGLPVQRFRSSDIVAPVFHVNTWNKNLIDDSLYIFLGGNLRQAGGGAGPMIFSAADLSLIYADDTWGNNFHSEPQTINGTTYLTFWAAKPGSDVHVVDENYNKVYKASAISPHQNEMHEQHITDEGTAVFSSWRIADHDNTPFGGGKPGEINGQIHDTGFQEVDLETGEELFSWWVSDHSDPKDTYARYEAEDFGLNEKKEGSWDISHLNGARKTKDGNYLISNRNFCNVQLINGTKESKGAVIWTLGGKANDFKDLSGGKATDICWQHNARYWRDDPTQITMFDNHLENQGNCGDDCHSRGLHIEIDPNAMTARLVREYYHPGKLDSLAMGGMHKLDSGNALVAWGWTPSIVEYGPNGGIALDIQRGKVGGWRQQDVFSYRVFKGEWVGRPTWPPSVVAERSRGDGAKVTFFMSWNGATDIADWRIYSSDQSANITTSDNFISEVSRGGFETSVPVEAHKVLKYVVVTAVTKGGEILGKSEVYDMEDAVEAEDGTIGNVPHNGDGRKKMSYAGAGSAFGGILATAGVLYVAVLLYRRWKHKVPRTSGGKYMPILLQD